MAAAAGVTGWARSRWARLNGPGRLGGIDLARGLAVVGMLAAHLLVIEPLVAGRPDTWLDIVNGRSSILFATLAGVSLAIVTGGRTPLRGGARVRASGRIAVRAGLLWIIGLLLISTGVPVYVILPAYAILFLLALPFVGLRARTLFFIAVGLALVMPFVQVGLDDLPIWSGVLGEALSAAIGWAYPFPTWIAFVLTGMALGRLDLRSLSVQGILLCAGAAVTTVTYSIAVISGSSAVAEQQGFFAAVWTARAHSTGLLEVIGSGAFAVTVIAACLLLCRTALRWVVLPLRAVGSMPLTAYTAQLLVWAVVSASVLGTTRALTPFRELEPFGPITVGIIVGCTAWALLVGRGPLEAAIDTAARWMVREPGRPVAESTPPARG
ncbi:heparan-alpha-glucosaminide N-acetyltransferase domain-containing protein [Microbacterium sp. P05]|uniref:heparan-alpha-glucosaminide N-acetyltransferase domain-containing protein n=1 Tax=Microbacterium sp. P05 TaxID=3366948 RepID=UPI003746CE8C